MSIIIHTRENKYGNWWCSGTILGCDESFEAFTAGMAKFYMAQFLKDKGINPDTVKWENETTYNEQRKKEGDIQNILASTTRLDWKMFD